MIGYTTLGANDFEKSAKFYDALFEVCGASRIMELDSFIVWGTSLEGSSLALAKPYNGEPATVGNGVMVAIRAGTKDQVDAIYSRALELGGTDEGAPGPRGDGFYAGYFRDLEGNKLNAFFLG